MSRRTERLASSIQRELAEIIMRELNDPRIMGMPSITRVKVAEDLSVADVFVTIMGTPGQQTAALNALKHSSGMMRSRLTKELSIRVTPFIKFHIDEQLKKELEVLKLLDQVAGELPKINVGPYFESPEPQDDQNPQNSNPSVEPDSEKPNPEKGNP